MVARQVGEAREEQRANREQSLRHGSRRQTDCIHYISLRLAG